MSGLNINKLNAKWLVRCVYEATHKSNILVVVFDSKVLQNLENVNTRSKKRLKNNVIGFPI